MPINENRSANEHELRWVMIKESELKMLYKKIREYEVQIEGYKMEMMMDSLNLHPITSE